MSVKATINRIEDYPPNQFQQAVAGRIANAKVGGRDAIRFELRPGEKFGGTHRCEANVPGKPGMPYEVQLGSERWIRNGLWIPSKDAGGDAQSWRANSTIWQVAFDPPVTGDYFGLHFEQQNVLHLTGAPEKWTAQFDRWLDILIRLKHHPTAGECDLYIDDFTKPVFKSRGRKLLGTAGAYLKNGVYGTPTGTETVRWIAIEKMKIGTTRADVASAPTPGVMWITCPNCGTAYHT